ncbi:MAG: hypothetical protein PF484_02705 [Bacteroidales bacterium]|jgi:hypothetical protein|nr:hypothetical protein [Bacteroidales bacterium]
MPKVHKHILVLISGVLWSGVGIFLISLAFKWFDQLSTIQIIYACIGGLILGETIAYFGFLGLAYKNIIRINQYQNKVCIWAFQKWPTYILIAFMMSLGIFMRNTPYIPKFLLSPLYIGIGSALFIASFPYYFLLFKVGRKKNA